jgi:parallel beta-helix repeat protein
MKKIPFYAPLIWIMSLSLVIVIVGCNKEATQSPQAMLLSGTAQDASSAKMSIVVHAGESIQAAVNAAAPGSTIKIEPGTYLESVTVNKAGIKLMGLGDKETAVIIKNPGDEEDGIKVGDAGDGFVLQNVTVEDFEENGVVLDSVDNFKISHVTAISNGEYGIFPVHSSHGMVDHCTATGHTDTGIYVGQSSDVVMQYNFVHANVNGLEVENSSNVNVTYNRSSNNVCGILVDLLPGKDIKTSSNVHVAYNIVFNNNHKNFGEEGSLESVVPSGLGILVLGADEATVESNIVTFNKFAGITVFSTVVLAVLAGIDPSTFDIEPNPDGVHILNNVVKRNGYNPPVLDIPLPGVDLLWDGSGVGNCWSSNQFKTSYPDPLPTCN